MLVSRTDDSVSWDDKARYVSLQTYSMIKSRPKSLKSLLD